jgi:hypothetical protein
VARWRRRGHGQALIASSDPMACSQASPNSVSSGSGSNGLRRASFSVRTYDPSTIRFSAAEACSPSAPKSQSTCAAVISNADPNMRTVAKA